MSRRLQLWLCWAGLLPLCLSQDNSSDGASRLFVRRQSLSQPGPSQPDASTLSHSLLWLTWVSTSFSEFLAENCVFLAAAALLSLTQVPHWDNFSSARGLVGWDANTFVCNWTGVACDRTPRVSGL